MKFAKVVRIGVVALLALGGPSAAGYGTDTANGATSELAFHRGSGTPAKGTHTALPLLGLVADRATTGTGHPRGLRGGAFQSPLRQEPGLCLPDDRRHGLCPAGGGAIEGNEVSSPWRRFGPASQRGRDRSLLRPGLRHDSQLRAERSQLPRGNSHHPGRRGRAPAQRHRNPGSQFGIYHS